MIKTVWGSDIYSFFFLHFCPFFQACRPSFLSFSLQMAAVVEMQTNMQSEGRSAFLILLLLRSAVEGISLCPSA